ncbi:tyrosine-type recombinase/integrase [Paraburkholderia sp. D15]|uniref:tyrosine-type recombinase/integrase n=1 Tax=Paraburkholderia sp. D15 TaxID=2880218 RepID=UPI0024798FA9|nr:tyrosine-type recombinase/integrase [Paraburkholderia sp. D15]WGS53518.1 tyrosine-type recombinase/integrase [Paraburkholderia sp. D15]
MAARRRKADRRGWPPNLYKNSAGYYWFKNPADGKTFGLGRDFRLASAKVRTANAELLRRKGDVSLLQRIDGDDISLRAWCDAYEAARASMNKHTLGGIKAALNAVRKMDFSVHSVGKVTPKQIADALKLATEERGTSSAAKLRGVLLDVFREAIQHGHVEVGKNPVDAVFKPEVTITRSRLTLDEYRLIYAQAAKNPATRWIANAMELALVSGQRREDIGKMRFDDVKDGFLMVEQSKGKEGQRAKLRIPVSLRLDALGVSLEEVIRRCRDNVISKHMVHLVLKTSAASPGDTPHLQYISGMFAKMRDAAKISVEAGRTPATFHELRSLAARLYGEQYGAEFAQALLGHKSAEMTALYRDSRGREWTEIKLQTG